MQQDTFQRTCKQSGHELKAIDCVCIHPNCQISRFLCIKCVRDGIHSHGKTKDSYILESDEFHEKFANDLNKKQDSEIQQNQGLNNSISQLRQLITEIQSSLNKLLNVINQIEEGTQQNDNHHFQLELIKIKSHGFSQIKDEDINSFLTLNKNQRVDANILHQLGIYSNSIIEKAQKIKEWDFSQTNNFLIEFLNYQITELVATDKYVYSASISNDMKYIISGGEAKTLTVWDYESLKIIKDIKFSDQLSVSKFTNDSKLLFVSDRGGSVYQLDVTDDFNMVDKTEIHTDWINNLVLVNNSILITSSSEKTIIKTDLSSKQQLFKIDAHKNPPYMDWIIILIQI